jgi:hypothetical protein
MRKSKRHESPAPFFLLGISVPSQEVQNATTISGVGSADPSTISAIIEQARAMVPNFGGVLLWGGVGDMEINQEGGYLSFIKDLLSYPKVYVAPSALPETRAATSVIVIKTTRVLTATIVRTSVVASLVAVNGTV